MLKEIEYKVVYITGEGPSTILAFFNAKENKQSNLSWLRPLKKIFYDNTIIFLNKNTCNLNFATTRHLSVEQLCAFSEFSQTEYFKINYGKQVKELRLSKSYSQEKLVNLFDLDRTYIPGIDDRKCNVVIVVVKKTARALHLLTSEFLNALKYMIK